ncbi:hypothetical protein KOI35_14225 [Actinoplanes bogorensis]|uniref:Uncharacterized protein n=1 Tax=Paractinoplanes bogorensis TaxID=1610840 RepID=A0ABS5YNN7_9ACTN|nr:DUF6183 family protein [Actinoplanes bogorensis]MBU2664656.1 hypothetical protein [Actinoplanes bogorensis]
MDDPETIAAGIARLDDVTGVWAVADQGDADFVADLGLALWHVHGSDPSPPWQYRSVFDRVLRLLTLTPGPIDPAVRLLSVTIDRRQARYVASLLASAHSAASLQAFDDMPELWACLRQELVLRGQPVWPVDGSHPLDWLPSTLRPIEGQPRLPRYGINGMSGALPSASVRPMAGTAALPGWHETTTGSRIDAAVRNWAEHSNGRIEARTFAFDDDLTAEAVGAALAGVGLKSVRETGSGWGLTSAADAWTQLFMAASAGGAYGGAQFGAYGRLLAWQSLGALAGADDDVTSIEALAGGCEWFWFAGASDWFEQVAWDIGLAAVSPGRRRLAVLAATDTD